MMPSLDRTAFTMFGAVLDAAVRALALGSAAGLLLMVLRIRRAAIRLGVWTAVLAAAILMPAIARVTPTLPLPVPMAVAFVNSWSGSALQDLPVARTELQSATTRRTTVRSALRTDSPLRPEERVVAPVVAAPNAPLQAARATWVSQPSWPILAAALYLLGAGCLLLRMVAGWAMAIRLDRLAQPVTDPIAQARLRAHAASAGLARSPRLAETPAILVPMTMGVTRPAVLLPDGWQEWDAATLDAVLIHELAHIARRDSLTQRLSLLYRALAWFSPFSWWLHRRLVEFGEQASDDAALAAGVDRAAYAETLVMFFAAIGRAPARADWHVAMASGASVERRVDRILNWKDGRIMRLTRSVSLGIVLATALLAMLTASVQLVADSAAPLVLPPQSPEPAPLPLPPARGRWTVAAPDSGRARTESAQLVDMHDAPLAREIPTLVPAPQSADRFPRVDMSGALMIVLLFDLRTSSPEIRQRAIDSASRQINFESTLFRVGLSKPHVWRVATVGSPVETIQDFTWSDDKLQAAFAKVLATPAAVAAGSANVTAISAMCNDLARLPSGEKYFQNWPELIAKIDIGVMAPIDVRHDAKGVVYVNAGQALTTADTTAIENACRRPNVAYGAITISDSAPAPAASQSLPVSEGRFSTAAGRQLINFVFDPGLLPGNDLQLAVDKASEYVDRFINDASLVSVSALGPSTPVLQDFTADRDSVRAALKAVRTMSHDPVATDARRRGMTSMCGAMRRQQMESAQRFETGLVSSAEVIRRAAVVYLGTGVERGLESLMDSRAIVQACTSSGASFETVDVLSGQSGARSISNLMAMDAALRTSPAQEAGKATGIGFSIVPHQPGCPVSVLQTTSTLDSGYASAVVRNDSAKPIRSVTLAALVRASDPALATPWIFSSQGPITVIQPGATLEIATRLIDSSLDAVLSRQGAQAELGVVEVEFVDGSKWTYDLKAKGRFER